MPAAIDDLHVVRADHRDPVPLGEQVAERFEVTDHHVWLELAEDFEIAPDVLRPSSDRSLQVLNDRLPVADRVPAIGNGVAPDVVDGWESLAQVRGGPPG